MISAEMLKPIVVRNDTPSIVIRLRVAGAGLTSDTTTASPSEMKNTIDMRLMNGTALSASDPPQLAGNQKTKLISTDAIAPTSAPASVARGQNRPSRKITVMPGVTKQKTPGYT